MFAYTCPKCQNVNQADESQIGQRIPCPNCGNVNVVPAAEGEPTGHVPATETAPPPLKATMTDSDRRLWSMLAHLTALSGYVIPFGNIVGPLVVWLTKKDEDARVAEEGRKSLNFQISITIYTLVSSLLILVFVGILLLIGIGIFALVMVIINSIKANNGQTTEYPLSIEFIKPSQA